MNQILTPLKNYSLSFKNFLSLLALIAFFGPAFAQVDTGNNDAMPLPEDGPKRVNGGMGYFMPGYAANDLGQLNSYLGTDAFSSSGITLGGGGMVMIRSFMLGGEGGSLVQRKATVNQIDMTLDGNWGKFTLGYAIYGRKGLLIYPKVGIGGAKQRLTLINNDAFSAVDTVFAGGFGTTQLQKGGMFMSFGLGIDWLTTYEEIGGSGILLGLDAGYNLGITEKPWSSLGRTLSGGPNVGPNGFYVSLHIGIAGWNQQ